MGKGENADNQHFLLFPQCFLPLQGHITTSERLMSAGNAQKWKKYQISAEIRKRIILFLGIDVGAAGAAFAAPILSVGTACHTNKIKR